MTIKEYKQQLYDACREHNFFAQQALDRYDTAKTDQERECARIDNIQHLAAYHALQWALDKAIDLEQQVKQAKIDVLNELKDKMFEREYMGVKYKQGVFSESEIDELIKEVQNGEDKG